MTVHYLKIAARNLMKYKVQSAISIFGLATGIAFFIFGLHWLRYETSYDGFYPKADRTYLIYHHTEGMTKSDFTSPLLAKFLEEVCPQVEHATCTNENHSYNFTFGEEELKMPYLLTVDSSFVHIFPQRILYGRDLRDEHDIVLSESLARKYWNRPEKAIGTVLTQAAPKGMVLSGEKMRLTVVGIMEDAPENSTLRYDGFYQKSSRNYDLYNYENWKFMYCSTFLTLKEGVSPRELEQYLPTAYTAIKGGPKNMGEDDRIIHMSERHFVFAAEGSFTYTAIQMFTLSALLLLCCVMFNFLNLCLNRYYSRSREMKLRKSVGASNGKLTVQLLVDVSLQYLFVILLCGCMVELFIPFFEETYSIRIVKANLWAEFSAVIGSVYLLLMVILMLPLTQFIRLSTRHSLIGKPQTHRHHVFRQVSLSVQLVICLFFLASTVTLYRQVNFMRHTDMGFETEDIIEWESYPTAPGQPELLEAFKRLPMIKAYGPMGNHVVSEKYINLNPGIEWEGMTEEDKKTPFQQMMIYKDAEKLFKFRLVEGRTFEEADWTADADAEIDNITGRGRLTKVLVNETAIRTMNMREPIGQLVRIPNIRLVGGKVEQTFTDHEIIGVVKDLHTQGMKQKVYPCIIKQGYQFAPYLHYFQAEKGMEAEAIKAMYALMDVKVWNDYLPVSLNDKLDELNKSETATFRLFIILAVLCMLISLFGIFSISSSTIQQRRKEIAIRKVMGASRGEIIGMFFREYTVLVCLSGVVAFPLAYFAMSKWLEQYAYHISIGIPLFIVLLGAVIALVLLTVLQQVLRAVSENPAEVIKNE